MMSLPEPTHCSGGLIKAGVVGHMPDGDHGMDLATTDLGHGLFPVPHRIDFMEDLSGRGRQ